MRNFTLLSLLIMSLWSNAQTATPVTDTQNTAYKTPRLFNFDFMLRAGFESEHKKEEKKADNFSSFKFRDARLNVFGNITEDVGFRFRFRANRDFSPIADGSSIALDYAYITLKAGQDKRWLFTLGKQVAAMGSYELDINPLRELIFTDFSTAYSIFVLGARANYKIDNNHTISLQLHNTTNVPFDKTLKAKGLTDNGLKASKLPVGVYALWNGSFFDKKLTTMWSYNISQFADGHYSYLVGLGNQYKTDKQSIYLDLGYYNQQVDHFFGVTTDINNSLAKMANIEKLDEKPVRKNAVYKVVTLRFDQNIAPKWDFFIKGSYETAGAKNNIFSNDLKEKFTYSGAIQYKPLSDGDLRLYMGYQGQSTNYKDYTLLSDNNNGSICLGFFYTIPVLRAK